MIPVDQQNTNGPHRVSEVIVHEEELQQMPQHAVWICPTWRGTHKSHTQQLMRTEAAVQHEKTTTHTLLRRFTKSQDGCKTLKWMITWMPVIKRIRVRFVILSRLPLHQLRYSAENGEIKQYKHSETQLGSQRRFSAPNKNKKRKKRANFVRVDTSCSVVPC